jgi:hypothetical protein
MKMVVSCQELCDEDISDEKFTFFVLPEEKFVWFVVYVGVQQAFNRIKIEISGLVTSCTSNLQFLGTDIWTRTY